ncbi:MAG: light-harvesting protein [Pseudomonadota bacterium]
MNEGRLFLYVSPNVFIPIMFLVLVFASLAIHFSVLNNTTWFSDFLQGSATVEVVEVTAAPAPAVVEAPAPAPAAVEAAPAAEAAPAE